MNWIEDSSQVNRGPDPVALLFTEVVMRTRFLLIGVVCCAFLTMPPLAAAYRDTRYGFQINPPGDWKTRAYFDGKERLFDAMTRDGNVLVRVRAIHLPRPVSLDLLRGAYERKEVSGTAPYREEAVTLNGVAGREFAYHWKYRGHRIDVVSFFAVSPKRAFIVTRIIPETLLKNRSSEAEAVIRTFQITADGFPQAGIQQATPNALGGKKKSAPAPSHRKMQRVAPAVGSGPASDELSREEIDEIMNQYLE